MSSAAHPGQDGDSWDKPRGAGWEKETLDAPFPIHPSCWCFSLLLRRCPSPSRWHCRAGREVTACPGAEPELRNWKGWCCWGAQIQPVTPKVPHVCCSHLPAHGPSFPLPFPCPALLLSPPSSEVTRHILLFTPHPCSILAACTVPGRAGCCACTSRPTQEQAAASP